MSFYNSPGVNVSEVDLTNIVPAVSSTDGGFVGVFNWGPLNDVVLISNENTLVANFGKPSADTAISFFTCANFLAYANKLRVVRVASTAHQSVSYTVDTTGTTMTGTGFLNGTPALRVGSTVTNGGNTRTVTAVASDTSATLSSAFPVNLDDAVVVASIYVGALNATAEHVTGSGNAGIGILVENDDDYEQNHVNGTSDVGLWCAKHVGELGNSLRVSTCPSTNAFSQTLAGTISTTGTAVTGSGTAFNTKLTVGSILKDVASGEERTVTAVASATACTISSAFTTNLSGATCKAIWQYASLFTSAPNTSSFASLVSGSKDEMHVIVIDEDGKFSGVPGTILEKYAFVSKASDAKTDDGSTNYYVNKINLTSKYIRFMDHLPAGTDWGTSAVNNEFVAPDAPNSYSLTGGRDVNTGSAIDGAKLIGLDKFADSDSTDVALLMLGESTTAVTSYAINNIAEVRKDCIVFISPERADVVDNSGNEVEDSIAFRNTLPSSSYAFMDNNWKYQYDKYNAVYRWIPLNGDIAGLAARTDEQADAWWSFAGYNRGNIKNVVKLAYSPTKAERDDLYNAGINSVISQSGTGTILFGDKTLLAKPSAFDRINVRRLFIILEKAISKASKSTLFEFNDNFTRSQFRNLVEPFLRDVQGKRGIYDFRVVCDSTNNTAEVVDRNEFIADIYVKPARSINFIQLNFVAVRTGVEFTTIVGKF